jgi:hypothetical protein
MELAEQILYGPKFEDIVWDLTNLLFSTQQNGSCFLFNG